MILSSIRRIAITSEGPTLENAVDPRFGRAGGFVVVDLESMATSYVDNDSSQVLAQGAGIQAAENIANAGVQVLLTGQVGPKAWTALQATGVRVAQGIEPMTVGEAIARFKAGGFAFSDAPVR
jgi:predicted Fe-Mo cluster-binding NifX family protein